MCSMWRPAGLKPSGAWGSRGLRLDWPVLAVLPTMLLLPMHLATVTFTNQPHTFTQVYYIFNKMKNDERVRLVKEKEPLRKCLPPFPVELKLETSSHSPVRPTNTSDSREGPSALGLV